MIQISGDGQQIVQYSRIDHNYFHDVHYNGGNGWESIRAGLSGYTFSSSHTIIELNLFVNDANDPEIISVKSSDNIVRHNTVRSSAGDISQRHGNRNQYYGNYILGDGVAGSAGIRVFGGPQVLRQLRRGREGFGILLEGGESNDTTGRSPITSRSTTTPSPSTPSRRRRHPRRLAPARTAAHDRRLQRRNGVDRGAGRQHGHHVPRQLRQRQGGGTDANRADPKLAMMGELLLPGPGSPLLGAATMASQFPFVTDDISGTPRMDPAAVGASELPQDPARYGPLTQADVGPLAP